MLRVHGLASVVEADDGRVFRCAVRRLLKSLATDERSVVTTGDVVWIRPVTRAGDEESSEREESAVQKTQAETASASGADLPSLPLARSLERA